jgi:hypothetical protein
LAPQFALVMSEQGCEVEGGDRVEEEVDEIAFGEPVVGRGWEQVGLVGGSIAIRLGHTTLRAGRRRFGHGIRHYSKVMS